MKTLLETLRESLVIGASIAAVLIVAGVYILSHWYYGKFDVDPIPVETYVSEAVDSQSPVADIDLPSLEYTNDELNPEASNDSDDNLSESEPDTYELTSEDEALLLEHFCETLPPKRESPYGLGPYPDIPPDFPKQDIFDKLERYAETGHANISHELMYRVVIKLWNQGKKADSAIRSGSNGRVYPLYNDTVYVKWSELEHEDGSIETYMGSYLSRTSLADYEESVANGTQPSWLKVIRYEDGGIDPYSFLDLP